MHPLPRFSKDPSLQAQSPVFEPSPMCKLHGCAFCCHQGISCDVECRFGVVQDPNVRANESGFVMPPKERSDGAG